jgi:uncharacterized protein
MDVVILSFAIILLLLGLAGCFLPLLPGPPISFGALLLLNFTSYASFSTNFLLLMALIAIIVSVIDYFVPLWTTKKFGGSRWGIWGAAAGIVAGIFFFPPIGLIIGPLAGAVVGEIIGGRNMKDALKAGLGSFAGFLLGIGLKLTASGTMTFYFIRALF